MKRKTKNLCAILMAGCVAVSVGACGVTSGNSGSTGAGSGNVQGSSEASGNGASGGELSMIRVGLSRDTSFQYQGDETAENNTWVNLYRENGIGLDVMYEVDLSQSTEKLAQCVMSGEYPDIMSVDAKNFKEWAEQGVFADLTEGLEKYASDEIKEYYETEDGKAVYGGSLADEMKQGLALLQQMYNEGIISKDFVTAGQDQIIQDLSAGKVGMAFNIFYGAELAWKNAVVTQPDVNFVFAPVPGLTEDQRGQAFYTATPASFNVMSSQYDDMETFFKVLNLGTHYCGRPDNITMEEYEMYNGLPGKYTGYTLCVGGLPIASKNMLAYDKLQNAMKTGDTSELNAENLRDYNAMMKYVENRDRREELSEEELAAYDAGILYWSVWGNENCAYEVLHEMADLDNYLYSAYDTAATEKMNECSTSLVTLTKETIVDIIIGNKSVDDYDTFLAQWNEMGGEEITKEADAWYQGTK